MISLMLYAVNTPIDGRDCTIVCYQPRSVKLDMSDSPRRGLMLNSRTAAA